MPYLGRQLTSGNYLKLDDISSQFNGSKTTFNLKSGGNVFTPGSSYSLLVSLGVLFRRQSRHIQLIVIQLHLHQHHRLVMMLSLLY